jgi:hypothetical protein
MLMKIDYGREEGILLYEVSDEPIGYAEEMDFDRSLSRESPCCLRYSTPASS